MNLLKRRRSLLSSVDGPNIINGSELTWEKGTISNTGALNNSEYVIRTSNYLEINSKILTYIGPKKNTNNVNYFLFVVQYNAEKVFMSRDYLLDTTGQVHVTTLNPLTCFIKLAFGHSTATAEPTKTWEGPLVKILVENSATS